MKRSIAMCGVFCQKNMRLNLETGSFLLLLTKRDVFAILIAFLMARFTAHGRNFCVLRIRTARRLSYSNKKFYFRNILTSDLLISPSGVSFLRSCGSISLGVDWVSGMTRMEYTTSCPPPNLVCPAPYSYYQARPPMYMAVLDISLSSIRRIPVFATGT